MQAPKWMYTLPLRWQSLFRRGHADQELDDELRDHVERKTEQYVANGLTPPVARRQALLDLRGLEQVKENCRDARRVTWLQDLIQDLHFGLRMLRKSPGFTAVAILTLALGIGANTAIFSMIDAVLLKNLPYPHPEQLVVLWEDTHLPHYQSDADTPAPGNFADWKEQNTVFSNMAAILYRSWNLTGTGEPVRIEGEAVSANIFSVLQTYPMLGRAFTTDEEHPAASHVALLSYGLWLSRFGGDRNVVGRKLRLDEQDYRIIGVMPRNAFRFPDPTDQLYVPLALSPEVMANRGNHFLDGVVARLKPGMTVPEAQAEMNLIAHRLAGEHPETNSGVGARVVSLHDQVSGSMRRPILVLFAAVGLLLMMVCANLANLMLSRASVRAREIAVRAALGASRGRILRQLLVESTLLAVLGGALGLAFAFWGMSTLQALAPPEYNLAGLHLDASVCLFTIGVSVLSGLAFGLAPAFQSSRRETGMVLKEGARESASRRQFRTRGILVIVEMALGVIVLVGTGLLLRSFIHLRQVPVGFQTGNVLTLRAILRGPRYSTLAQQTVFYRQAFERIRTLPGIQGVGAITFLPLTMPGRTTGVSIEGQAPSPAAQLPFADYRSVSPGYFATMGIPLLRGRDFSWDDTPQRPFVVIVSQTMARAFWPNGDALGKRVKIGPLSEASPWLTVVGIVGNARQLDLTSDTRSAMYFPGTQDAGFGDTLRDWVVRVPDGKEPSAVAPMVRKAVQSLDPNLPVSRIRTMEQIRLTYLGPQRFALYLIGLFGMMGLILAAVGLYGVIAYSVVQRTHEIGIRLALGAQRRDVMRLVVGQGVWLATIGVAIGVVCALGLTRLMRSLLFEVTPTDPVTFVGVAVVLTLVALAACYIPARRAMRVDPMVALRYE